MFTIDQVKDAQHKVKSGADFPAYIQAIKKLGVVSYETFVEDGRINYCGENDYMIKVPAKFEKREIANQPNAEYFKNELKAHQQGKTDFTTFIKMCAEAGIEKWEIAIQEMTCAYFDKKGNKVLVEKIPG